MEGNKRWMDEFWDEIVIVGLRWGGGKCDGGCGRYSAVLVVWIGYCMWCSGGEDQCVCVCVCVSDMVVLGGMVCVGMVDKRRLKAQLL